MILSERKSGIYLTIHILYCVLKSFFFFYKGIAIMVFMVKKLFMTLKWILFQNKVLDWFKKLKKKCTVSYTNSDYSSIETKSGKIEVFQCSATDCDLQRRKPLVDFLVVVEYVLTC